MRNAQRFVNEVDSSAVYLTPLRVLPTAASLDWGRKWRKHTKTPRARPNGAGSTDHLQWIGIGDYTIRA